jgi:hypothetical protein
MKLAELSKTEAVQKLQRAYQTAKRYRQEAKHAAKVTVSAATVTAGGVLGGWLSESTKTAYVPGSKLRTDVALGSALVLAAAADMLDGANDSAADIGAGLLAYAAGREWRAMRKARGVKIPTLAGDDDL